jgi:renalase
MQHSAIVGAGIAGLGAARGLCAAGHRLTLFEKSVGLGGRVATRRIENCIVDHGAQIIKPQDSALEHVMLHELPTEDLLRVNAPTRVYRDDGSILPPDPQYAAPQYTYRSGISTLAKLLFAALPQEQITLKRETRIVRIEEDAEGFRLFDERGTTYGKFDSVVLTPPAPQSAELLRSSVWRDPNSMLERAETLASATYHPCLTVLLGYAAPAPEPPAYALLAGNRARPLLWLAFEQTKSRHRAPDGQAVLIAQFGGDWSREHYTQSEEWIIEAALSELRGLFGSGYARPQWSQVKRWRYSQPDTTLAFEIVNSPASRLILCGDALRPDKGRVHQAFASGLQAAGILTHSPKKL